MFGLGMGEILVLLVVALLFLGPEKLPGAAKSLSKGIREFRRHTRDLQSTLEEDTQIGDAYRDLRSALRGDELRGMLRPRPQRPLEPPKGSAEAAQRESASAATGQAAAGAAGALTDEAGASTDGNGDEPAPEDDVPLVEPAADAVPRGPVARPRENEPGDDDEPGDAKKAHG